tara:strand:+ start:32 stop:337 length:306 start_codon:yes stop_codon:yes gene_type:complete
MNVEGLTIYNNQSGGFKSLGWNINNTFLAKGASSSLVVPAGLLYLNNNFKSEQIKKVEQGVVKGEIFDKLYSFIDGSKSSKNKTRKKSRKAKKRKNKTRKY